MDGLKAAVPGAYMDSGEHRLVLDGREQAGALEGGIRFAPFLGMDQS